MENHIAYSFADAQERLSFLESVAKKVDNPNSQDAHVYATVAVATVKLELKDLEGTRKDLDKSEKILDGFDSVETIVHASFYRVNAEYYEVGGFCKLSRDMLTIDSPKPTLPHTIETLSFISHVSN